MAQKARWRTFRRGGCFWVISVIVACLDEAATLGEALDSLIGQDAGLPFEIILADNGSTDGSREIFLEMAARRHGVPMRLVDASDRRGKSHAVNLGIAAARGERLLFLDADDTAAPGWLAAMAAALERCDFVAARTDVRALNPDWALASRRNLQDDGLPVLTFGPECRHAGGATLGFHRRVFDVVGAFDPELIYLEDTDFCIRAHLAGFELRFVPEAVYNYRFRTGAEAMRRQAYSYARFRALLRRRYAAGGWRFAPLPWLRLGAEAASIAVWRATRRRPLAPAEMGWFNRRLGGLQGDAAGALAFGVAPSLGLGTSGARLRRLLDRVRNRVAAPFCGATVAVATREKLLALTFDDGPDPESTPALLDLLARVGARATFFVLGARAAQNPELIARILAEGHEIGNHTWDHPSLTSLTPDEAEAQLRRTRDSLAPHGQALMRPPYGHQDFRVNRIARRLGHRVVLWNVNGGDWQGEGAEAIAGRILAQAAPGAIVLLHDSLYTADDEAFRDRAPTIEAVAQVVAGLPDYRFVTVSELLRRGAPVERVRFRGAAAGRFAGLGSAAASVCRGDWGVSPIAGAAPEALPAAVVGGGNAAILFAVQAAPAPGGRFNGAPGAAGVAGAAPGPLGRDGQTGP